VPPSWKSDRASPRPSATLAALAPLLAILVEARASLGALIALGVARHLLRLVPTLAIGLAVDHVASARAGATLVAVVSLLCLAAAIETGFAGAQQRLHAALRAHLAATAAAFEPIGARQRARHGAALDLLVGATTAPPAMLAMLAALAMASGRLAALACGLLAVQAATTTITGRVLRRLATRLRTAERSSEEAHADAPTIARVLRAGARARARRRERHRARLARRVEAWREKSGRMTALIGRIGFALVLGLGCLAAMSAAITPGALIAVMLVLRQLQGLADGLGATWLRAVETAADPAPHPEPAPRRPPAPTIELVPGEFVAVVGGTAAGKSLLLRGLIARASATGATRTAWVEQHPRLCDMTIAEVLRLAQPRRDEARLREALRVSQLARALRHLPAGLAQRCGAQGESLSAGARALVALAAALCRAPRLLVLDALPDALDPGLRAPLLAALQDWRRDGRSLVVATSVGSWIAAADRVVLVEDGRVRADLRPRRAAPRAA
jgi:ABC-type bacteriocin/lantibiotic exporter with double-glycine peptidase domain